MKNIFDITDNFRLFQYKSILKVGTPIETPTIVSIVIPVYRSFDYFVKALNSAINQTYKQIYQVIVVDNNYEDDVKNENEFESYIRAQKNDKVLYYKNEKNMGPAHNFNRAGFLANSEYFVMCHEDDELSTDCLEKLLKFKDDHAISNQLILTPNTIIDSVSQIKNKLPFKNHFWNRKYNKLRLWDFFLSSPSNGCGCLINRDAFIKIGGYNPNYRPSADYAMLSLYIYKYGGYRINNVSTYRYRISDSNASNNVFYTCIERDEFYRNCMKEKFVIPNIILNRIITANKRCHTERTEKIWLHQIHHPAPIIDKMTMKVVEKINAMIHRLFG